MQLGYGVSLSGCFCLRAVVIIKIKVAMSNGTYLSSSFTYLNLGCHMLFVLKNRLKAQGIAQDKTLKIVNDLVGAIFKEQFVKTLLIPQEPINLNILKDIFRKLAHSSIMKLDSSSMEKLLYLIIMTVKKEVFLTSSPLELFALTVGNLRMLHHHSRGAASEGLVKNAIEAFSSAAASYSYIQYLEIRDYLLTSLESYQTKVINFHEAGQQNDQGKLTFIRRNAHNRMPVGATRNHPPLKISQTNHPSNQIALPLKEWRQWRTSLVLDHPTEYEKQSIQRQSRAETSATTKDKSLNQLFGLQKQNIEEFQVRLDLFQYGEEKKAEKEAEKKAVVSGKNLEEKAEVGRKGKENSSEARIKGKIEMDFAALDLQKEEEPDLLDLMDN